MTTIIPKIALGAWSWGAGAVGGDQVFGNLLSSVDLQPVFDKAMTCGLNLWDTAAVYGEGSSERILGTFIKNVRREDVVLSTKFTPQIASDLPGLCRKCWMAAKSACTRTWLTYTGFTIHLMWRSGHRN